MKVHYIYIKSSFVYKCIYTLKCSQGQWGYGTRLWGISWHYNGGGIGDLHMQQRVGEGRQKAFKKKGINKIGVRVA